MSKVATIPPTLASAPHVWDDEMSITANATQAWERKQARARRQYEITAQRLAKKLLHLDEIQIEYDAKRVGLTTPTFRVDGELFAFDSGHGSLALVELCAVCGDIAHFRPFVDAASLGENLAYAEADPFECRMCRVLRSRAAA